MSEPSFELQRKIFQVLMASDTLKTAMGGTVRAYDRVPPGATFPYITISGAQALDNGNSCEEDMFEIFKDVHVWSREVGMAETMTIAGIVRGLILGIEIANDWNIPVRQITATNHLDDPDKITTHSIITARFLLEPIGD